MSKQTTDTRSASEMPAGDMTDLHGQPGIVVDSMPAGAMTSETAMISRGMFEGHPGVEGDMPSHLPAAAVDAAEMPAGSMSPGQPGVEGGMPGGPSEAAPQPVDEAASTPSTEEQTTTFEITGKWRLTVWVSGITRN